MKTAPLKILHIFLTATIGIIQLPCAQTQDTLIKSLEQQQTYIRNIVEEEKQQILKNAKSSDPSKDLQNGKFTAVDSVILKQIQAKEQQTASLKDATRVESSHKSVLKKTLIIGGLSSGAIAGALAYFLINNKNSQNSNSDSYITDTPPLHP